MQDGFSVIVRRKADPALTRDACIIEVRDHSGRLVLMREGFNTKLHDESGRDVDNDGSPDLVIGSDSRGTNWCCSEDTVLSLKPAPHVVGTFSNPRFEVDRTDARWCGPCCRSTISQRTWGRRRQSRSPGNIRTAGSSTSRPRLPRDPGRNVPGWTNLSEDLWRLDGSRRAASRAETGPPSVGVETTRGSATVVALQMFYCGRDADARELIRQIWPERQQEPIRASLAAAAEAARRR